MKHWKKWETIEPQVPTPEGKYSIYEGGTRTPFIAYWPGTIKPGVSDEVVCTIDFAGSLASHLGVKLPEDACLDSLDVMDAMLGKKGAKGSPILSSRIMVVETTMGTVQESGNYKGMTPKKPRIFRLINY
jgi:hypothetical protein